MQQQMVIPEGGLATFLTSNMDEFDDSRLAFGFQNGINSMRDVAERMARLGRNGDVHLAHLEQGEGVVPRQVRENNPELVVAIDAAIAAEGADPSAYVVGSETNSINPYTGQREFFLKKLVRGVKDVFKKIAPIIVPLGLNLVTGGAFGAMSLVAQGAITGGISSFIQGGNLKDSLKSAAIGGFLGGVSGGLQKGLSSGQGTFGSRFGEGFKESLQGTFQKPDPRQFLLGDKADSATKDVFDDFLKREAVSPDAEGKTFYDSLLAPFKNQKLTVDEAAQKLTGGNFNAITDKTVKEAAIQMAQASGGYNPYKVGAAGLGVATLAGAFDPIDPEKAPDPYAGPSASEVRLAQNPDMYRVGRPVPFRRPVEDVEISPTNLYEQYMSQRQFAAKGGEMKDFPRRTGFISGPGTETSDDVPAMLSDGEFVMTARAVRGAGNGSRKEGVRKMYDMMRSFEGGAVA